MTDNLPILDHSNGMFIVFIAELRLYQQLFANCRHQESYIDVMAFNNSHFLVALGVVLIRQVQMAWGLIGEGGGLGLF